MVRVVGGGWLRLERNSARLSIASPPIIFFPPGRPSSAVGWWPPSGDQYDAKWPHGGRGQWSPLADQAAAPVSTRPRGLHLSGRTTAVISSYGTQPTADSDCPPCGCGSRCDGTRGTFTRWLRNRFQTTWVDGTLLKVNNGFIASMHVGSWRIRELKGQRTRTAQANVQHPHPHPIGDRRRRASAGDEKTAVA
ncbi:hypothetical protein V9T40_013172 [Parthenolecanium corni]|uniref:Uncharacterized protein n=1 Tax=Parthenolecanium corni TaxID=536013 RepID=A0AAN9Y6P1_9HEMI